MGPFGCLGGIWEIIFSLSTGAGSSRWMAGGAVEFAQLPFDVDLAGVQVAAFQADGLAPAQAGVGDRDEHGEVAGAAGQQGGAFGEQ